ncbi:cardiolipin synthase [Paracoccus sp. MC1862]|uniref:cardiolipin synthase n=2 Tax=Paracoccus sp. MC1862 TaxID=2760307 RepID=UPI0019098B36|nr:cardiolipin synthase [Paracoccus sp. MC1862]QQO45541.1 cardiolipin synthase [Paracoccus sp. MC1862]
MMQATMTTILSVAFAGYLVVTVTYIISENRRPSATFAWMLLFFVLPGLGVVVYLLFGRKHQDFGQTGNLMRQELADRLNPVFAALAPEHERAVARMDANGGSGRTLAQLVYNTSHSTITTRNEVRILHDAKEAYPPLIEDMKAARQSIHLQYFSWNTDALADELYEILSAKAAEGVDVRIIYDPVGSLFMLKRRLIRKMRAAGIRMEPFSKLWRVHTISYRNHRKIAVFDGVVGHTGGLNIGCEHIRPPEGFETWRDTNIRVVGSAATLLQAVFAVDWHNATGEDLFRPENFSPAPDRLADAHLPVQMTLSGPDSEWQAIRQLYFAMITSARKRVYMQSPFFILDTSISEALKAAALSGVDVRVMISERGTNQHVPYWAANTYMEEIAASGASVLLYEPGYMHAKTVITDGVVCSVGSANIDIRSFSINYELNAVIYDAGLSEQLERAFLEDSRHCRAFTAEEYRSRNAALRFRDSVARLFSPLM